jgi:phage terminase small subunit
MKPKPQPEIAADVPEPPPFITGYAADEWWTTAPELHRLGLLTRIDVPSLAAYCQPSGSGAWRLKHWRRCRRTIRS